MAKRGRSRKPTKRLKLHGTYREDRRYVDEPTPEVGIPRRPKFLTGEARKEWERIAPLLAKMKCLTEWDRSLLTAYCFEWGLYVQLCRKVKFKDLTMDTINSNKIQNPLLTARNRALKNFKEIATEFGLTPSSRTRLSVSKADDENPFRAFMDRNRNAG
ncbi:MAG: phage terminase small subunit P27 family [Sedimentisphaerales bacterium]|nr:phage terminase small subunit P27 family [Sedimentisphaerales bacterium]